MEATPQNELILCGTIHAQPEFSHESHGCRFLSFPISVKRLSGVPDIIRVLVDETLFTLLELQPGEFLRIKGELRSFNNKSGIGSRLVVTAYAKELARAEPKYENELSLCGVVCKTPSYRKTPLGREICDLMLAINRRYGRADYLPCIVWGKQALTASGLGQGDVVSLTGRIQSREYTKLTESCAELHTTYEVSVFTLHTL